MDVKERNESLRSRCMAFHRSRLGITKVKIADNVELDRSNFNNWLCGNRMYKKEENLDKIELFLREVGF